MSISYSGLTNYGKVTLPSVDSGLDSMNVLKDPNKGIFTRRIDKVNANSDLTQWVGESSDRACEYITQYARGVNPMVSVSYSNNGNNGGQRTGSFCQPPTNLNGGVNARTPYSLGRAGFNFRPPVRRQEQLLPQSRMPRVWTYAYTSKDFPDFTKKMRCPQGADKTKEVHTESFRTSARPTAVFNLQKPTESPARENFEVKYVVENPIHVSAGSGRRTQDLTTQHNLKPVKNIINNPQHLRVGAKMGSQATVRHSHTDNNLDTERYLQTPLHADVMANKSQQIQTTPINEIMDLQFNTKDPIKVNYTAPVSMTKAEEYNHTPIELDSALPRYEAFTNSQDANHYVNPILDNNVALERNTPIASIMSNAGTSALRNSNTTEFSPEYRLPERPSYGGFENGGIMPTDRRIQDEIPSLRRNTDVARRAAEQLESRYEPARNILEQMVTV